MLPSDGLLTVAERQLLPAHLDKDQAWRARIAAAGSQPSAMLVVTVDDKEPTKLSPRTPFSEGTSQSPWQWQGCSCGDGAHTEEEHCNGVGQRELGVA